MQDLIFWPYGHYSSDGRLLTFPADIRYNSYNHIQCIKMETPFPQTVPFAGPHFFYYTPDPASEGRMHGHFTPHPQGMATAPAPVQQIVSQDASYFLSQVPSLPMGPMMSAQLGFNPHQGHQKILTPITSPRALSQKPTILVQQESPYIFPLEAELYAPSTPPLHSSSSSVMSTPPSSHDVLLTPATSLYTSPTLAQAVKKGCEEEVMTESLTVSEWLGLDSPPLTPGM